MTTTRPAARQDAPEREGLLAAAAPHAGLVCSVAVVIIGAAYHTGVVLCGGTATPNARSQPVTNSTVVLPPLAAPAAVPTRTHQPANPDPARRPA
jgi:hypothetical protein